MNHRVVYARGGPPADVLTDIDGPKPAPERGQVLIRTTAFPVHPGDLQAIEAYPGKAATPIPAGVEATGRVTEIGPGTHTAPGVEVGSRVTVFPQPGAWAQWIAADAEVVVAVPDELSDEVAAQMLVNPLTAVMLRREAEEHLAFGYGGVLVQTAAGSSVGRLVTGTCEVHNLPLVNVVRSERGAAELRKRFPGVPVVVTEHPGWADEVRKVADGRPVSVAFDPIGGKLTESLLDLLAPGGKLVSYGQMAEEPISVHASTLLHKSLTLRGRSIGRWLFEASAERRASDIAAAKQIALVLKDQFDVAATYSLRELAEAIEHAVRPGKVGTVLVRP